MCYSESNCYSTGPCMGTRRWTVRTAFQFFIWRINTIVTPWGSSVTFGWNRKTCTPYITQSCWFLSSTSCTLAKCPTKFQRCLISCYRGRSHTTAVETHELPDDPRTQPTNLARGDVSLVAGVNLANIQISPILRLRSRTTYCCLSCSLYIW